MGMQTHLTINNYWWNFVSNILSGLFPLEKFQFYQANSWVESENKATHPQIRNITFVIEETKQRRPLNKVN